MSKTRTSEGQPELRERLMAPQDAATRARRGARKSPERLARLLGEQLGIFALLLVIFFAFVLASPGFAFLSLASIKDIFLTAAEMTIMTVGEAIVLIAGEIDLSVGSNLVLASVCSAEVMLAIDPSGGDSVGAVIAGMVVAVSTGCAVGLLNGLITTRFRIPSFLVTLGTLSITLGLAEVLTGGVDVAGLPSNLQSGFGDASVAGVPDIVILAVLSVAVASGAMAKTRFGRRTYIIGSSRDAASRSGIPVSRHVTIVFVLMGALAGIAGFVEVARFASTDIGGHSSDALTAIAGAAIGGVSIYGGRGRVWQTLAGVLIPVTIETGLIVAGVTPFWQVIAVGWLIIVAVGIDIKRRGEGARGTKMFRLRDRSSARA